MKSPYPSFWLEGIQLLERSYWNLRGLPFSDLEVCMWCFSLSHPLSPHSPSSSPLPAPPPINKLVLCCVFFLLPLALMQSAGIRLAFTLFSFWENYFLLHLLWMLTPFLFTTLLGHIPVLFCSLTQQMVYTFFCLSVMLPSSSASKCVSPPGTQFRLSAAHISPGPNPAKTSFHRQDYSDFLRLSVDERICLSSRFWCFPTKRGKQDIEL